MVKKIKGTAFIILSFIIGFTCITIDKVSADMPVQDNTAIGQPYDGINFDELIGNGVYFGSYSQLETTSTKEDEVTPILWRVVGEDGASDGTNMDGALTLFSEYVLDTSVFSGFGVESYSVSTFSGEAGYDTSYIQEWLNEEDLYDYYLPNAAIQANPGAYGYSKIADRDGFLGSFKITDSGSTTYNAEINAIATTTVSTYFIAQGTTVLSEVVVENPGSIKTYNSGYTQGTWESYFAGYSSFSKWPTDQTDQYVYLPTAIYSYSGHARHNKVYWNADGTISASDGSTDYSLGEAGSDLAKSTTKYGTITGYWTRSPEATRADSGSIRVYVVSGTTGNVSHASARSKNGGVRPLTKLDPEKIVMTHEIVEDKPTLSNQLQTDKEDSSFWNYATGEDDLTNYKLTLVSDKVELNSLNDANDDPITSSKLTLESGGSIKVSSDDYVGDYLAYKIVHTNTNGEREIVAYGTSKGSTPDELEINGIKSTIDNSDLGAGDYTLYIWAQGEDTEGKDGASVHSYEASNQMTFDLSITEKASTYTVLYNGNTNTGRTAPADGNNPYNTGSIVTVLDEDDLVKTDYKFMGWSTSSTGSVEYTAGSTFTITGDVTLYAVWEPITTYTITYDGNTNTGGTVPVDSKNPYHEGTTVTVLAENNLVKVDHKFMGWSTTSTGSVEYVAGSTFTITGNMVLYAIWEPLPIINYTVTFESNGGSLVASQTGMNIGDYVVEPTNPTRDGYKFMGWYLDDGTFLNEWDFDTDTISGDTILYAKWAEVKDTTPEPEPTNPSEPNPQEPINPDSQPDDSTSQSNPSTKPSETTEGKDTDGTVETGDTTNIVVYLSLLILSSIYFVGKRKFINK